MPATAKKRKRGRPAGKGKGKRSRKCKGPIHKSKQAKPQWEVPNWTEGNPDHVLPALTPDERPLNDDETRRWAVLAKEFRILVSDDVCASCMHCMHVGVTRTDAKETVLIHSQTPRGAPAKADEIKKNHIDPWVVHPSPSALHTGESGSPQPTGWSLGSVRPRRWIRPASPQPRTERPTHFRREGVQELVKAG